MAEQDSNKPIIDITGHTEPWAVRPNVRCANCGHKWVAVTPANTVPTECPKCGKNPHILEAEFNV